MTNPPWEPGDQPGPGNPGYGYQPPPPGGRKTGLIGGVIGLVVGVGIGVAGFAIASGDDPRNSTGTAPVSRPPIETGTTSTSTSDRPDQGAYSMSSVGNACDLVDPTLLTRWAATPYGTPEHWESPPSRLTCSLRYATPSAVDPYQHNEAGISLDAEFTQDAYDDWKQRDTATTGAGLASGDVTGLGSRGYWRSETDDTSKTRLSYLVAVQDDNVSVRVRLSLSLGDGEPPVTWEEMNTVVRAEIQLALDALRKT